MVKRVHFKKKPYDIYCGRPSFWGNPYSHKNDTLAKYKVSSRKESVEMYERFLNDSEEHQKRLPELMNKILGCWCEENELCHCDVLIRAVQELELNEKIETAYRENYITPPQVF